MLPEGIDPNKRAGDLTDVELAAIAGMVLRGDRWRKMTKAERSEHARMMGKARAASMTPEQMSAQGKAAAAARWKKEPTVPETA